MQCQHTPPRLPRPGANREEEQSRVDKELANIRKHFAGSRETAYDRKKYTWKLIYIFMLGYEVDFGMEQVKKLLGGATFAEKVAGYMAVSVLVGQQDESMGAVCAAIREDLRSPLDSVQCMALSAIANKGGKRMGAALAPDVREKTFSVAAFPPVRRRAALALLRVFRVDPDYLPLPEYSPQVLKLLDDRDVSVKMAGLLLLTGVAPKALDSFASAVPTVVRLLQAAQAGILREDFKYHHTNAPWFQVQCLRFLQLFPRPPEAGVDSILCETLEKILNGTKITRSVNRNNADHAVLFEAVNLIIKYGEESETSMRNLAMQHLTRFINIKEPNIRYLGLVCMTKLSKLPGTLPIIKREQERVLLSLKDADLSIRRRALDLLFAMCDRSNAISIVKELLSYLSVAEFAIKEEMVLRLAILSERFAPNLKWYVDTIMELVSTAGDFVSDDIWHRVVYIVTNHTELQAYAAHKLFQVVEAPVAHETAVKLGGYILGEFGFLLANAETCGDIASPVTGGQQFAALQQHLESVSTPCKALLLTTFLKLQNFYPPLKPSILPLFEKYSAVMDAELQQRAVEYFHLPLVEDGVTAAVLGAMPAFPEKKSRLERRLAESKRARADTDHWAGSEGGGDAAAAAEHGAGAGTGAGSVAEADVGEEAEEAEVSDSDDDDLLGMSASPAPAAAHSDAALPTEATQRVGLDKTAPLAAWLAAFATKRSGPLYRDATVDIEADVGVRGEEGTITLTITNKTAAPLNLLKVRVPPVPYMSAEVQDVSKVVYPGKPAQVSVQVESLRPFGAPADLQVSFLSAPSNGHAYPLRLPLFPNHFIVPVPVSKEAYAQRWRTLKPEAGIVECAAPAVQDAGDLLAALGFAETLRDAAAVYGAASYKTTTVSQATGAKVAVGCLVKVAVTEGGYAAEVRTQHPDVSKALFGVLRVQLRHTQS